MCVKAVVHRSIYQPCFATPLSNTCRPLLLFQRRREQRTEDKGHHQHQQQRRAHTASTTTTAGAVAAQQEDNFGFQYSSINISLSPHLSSTIMAGSSMISSLAATALLVLARATPSDGHCFQTKPVSRQFLHTSEYNSDK